MMYTARMKNILKSIGAVLTGFLTVFILSVVTDKIVEALGIFPPPTNPAAFQGWMLWVALLYRSLYAVVGGYVTAMLAPRSRMHHVAVLGILGTIGGLAGVIAAWELGNHWYPIALAVTAFPLVWWGGKLYVSRKKAR